MVNNYKIRDNIKMIKNKIIRKLLTTFKTKQNRIKVIILKLKQLKHILLFIQT